ncbi:hypothetical protein [Kangiella marina]|uniref:Uncharacterized protein n=1 Tax=Kangiella marina TaxID=1079178 RepID=A0ABP8IDH2_9GAMM
MSKTELSTLHLSTISDEERLKITQGIVDDLIRALNLGNYSLVWRYFSDAFTEQFGQEQFANLHQQLIQKHQKLTVVEPISSSLVNAEDVKSLEDVGNVESDVLSEKWRLSDADGHELSLTLTFKPIKEFLVIEAFSIA